jgi:hypothetical protein
VFLPLILQTVRWLVIFPEEKIELGELDFPHPYTIPDKAIFNYRIYCDKGKYQEGSLTLEFSNVHEASRSEL